jgi:hypothetical protein
MAIVDQATGRSSLSLDIDGDGVSLAGGDGVLLARHLAGFTGDSLVAGAVNPLGGRTVASAIEQFLSFGRVTVNNDAVTLLDGNGSPKNVQGAGFGGAELSNTDRFGVARALDPGPNATEGSAPTTPAHSNFAPPGATASSAARATFVQTATALPSFTYDLTTFGQTVTYESFYLDAIQPNNLVSRVPQATPMDISSSPTLLGLLVNLDQNQINGIESRIIQGPAEHKRLGSDEPIFIEVPDAAGYEYQAATGFRFQTVHFDTDVGGNMYLGNEFDLYLNDGTAWVYAATIAAQDGIDFAAIGYANGVDRFQLFGTALPDASLHRAANDAAPGTRQLDDGTIVYELPTTVGFTLAGPDLVPTVQLTQLRPRLRATTPVDVQVCKINCGFAFGQNAEFLIVRNSLNAAVVDVAYRFTDQPGDPYKQLEPIELTSATGITVLGDAHEDVVLFDHTRGPIRLPITFHGGSGTNLLGQQNQDVLRVRGRNVTIDLTGRDEITGVERVDIRGEGPNKLKLDLAAVKRNRDTANTLMVLASSDDAVDIGSGWIKDAAQVTIDGIPFDSYRQGGTTVLLSDPTASAAAQIQAEALPQFSAPPVVQPLSQATASAQARTSLGSGEEPVPKAVQRITASPAVLQVAPGRTLNVDILYSALGNVGTTGLHLQMFFDSSKVDLATVRNQLGESLSAVQIRDDGPCTAAGDCLGRDGNPATDKYLNIMWLDADGDWLAGAVAPVRLYTAEFTAANDFDGTTIGFAGNPAQGFALDAVSLAVSARVDSAPEPPQVTDVAFVTAGSGRKSTINAIRVTFSEPMSLVAVENLANYAFRFAERNNRVIPLSSATFDPNSLTVALNLAQPLKPKGSYDLVINALNVTDLAGNPLDGDSDGLPGGDYISLIVLGSSLSYIEPDGDLVELHSTELMQLNNESGGQLKLLADHATLTGSVQTPRKGAGDGFALLNSVDPKFDNRLPNSFLIGAGQIEFRSANYSGPEHSGDVVVTVVRTGGRAGSVSVDYATSDNTAAASLDYTPVAGTLRFTHGESSKTFIVPILDDILQDFDETIDLTLSNPSSDVALGPQSTATLTIRDDEDSNADFDGPTVLDYEVILDSRSRVTTVRLSFDEPLDRTAAEDDTNFSLVLVGRVPQAIAFYPASYDNLTQAVQLDLVKPLRVKPSKPLQVIVDDLLTDASGNRLDGNNDGRPGGDYLLYFGQR